MIGIATSISLGIISSSDSSPDNSNNQSNSKKDQGNSRGSKGNFNDDKKKSSNKQARFHKRDRLASSPDSTHEEDELTDFPPKKDQKNDSASEDKPDSCDGCGLPNHSKSGCKNKDHPGFNNSNHSWKASLNGKKYAELGHDTIKLYLKPDGTSCKWQQRSNGKSLKKHSTNDKGMINLLHSFQPVSIHEQTVLAIESTSFCAGKDRLLPIDDNLLLIRLANSPSLSLTNLRQMKALVDTGARDASYINENLATYLDELGHKSLPTQRRVCSGLSNTSCIDSTRCYSLDFIYMNEVTSKEELIILNIS